MFPDFCCVAPYPASTAKKKNQTQTTKKTPNPQLFEMEFTPKADSASQSAAMHMCQLWRALGFSGMQQNKSGKSVKLN